MGRAAAAQRSMRRPTARPSQRPQAATDPLDLATDTHIRPQALQTRQTSTSRPRIEASAQNEIAFGSGVVARRPPHSLHASPKPLTASRWAPAPPTTPLRHLQRPRDGDNAVRPEPDRRGGARGSRPLGRRDYRARAVTRHSMQRCWALGSNGEAGRRGGRGRKNLDARSRRHAGGASRDTGTYSSAC